MSSSAHAAEDRLIDTPHRPRPDGCSGNACGTPRRALLWRACPAQEAWPTPWARVTSNKQPRSVSGTRVQNTVMLVPVGTMYHRPATHPSVCGAVQHASRLMRAHVDDSGGRTGLL